MTNLERRVVVLAIILGSGCAATEPRTDPEATQSTAVPDAASNALIVVPPPTTAAINASASAVSVSQREALIMRAGERSLEITFRAGPGPFVATIKEGESSLAIPRLKSKGAAGRGEDLVLIDHVAREGRAYALFAATTHGSPECGSYGFWALRVDAKGVRVTPMIEGCFLSVGDGHPKITWSDPAVLVVESPQYQSGASIEVFTLDEASFVFRSRVQAKVPD